MRMSHAKLHHRVSGIFRVDRIVLLAFTEGLVSLLKPFLDTREYEDVDDDGDSEDRQPPAVAQNVAEVLGVLRKPARVAGSGPDLAQSEGRGRIYDGDYPHGHAYEVPLEWGGVDDPGVEVDRHDCHDGDGEDGEIGALL